MKKRWTEPRFTGQPTNDYLTELDDKKELAATAAITVILAVLLLFVIL